MSDLDLIQMLLSDPLVTQSDIEIFQHQPGKSPADQLMDECPMRPLSRAFQRSNSDRWLPLATPADRP